MQEANKLCCLPLSLSLSFSFELAPFSFHNLHNPKKTCYANTRKKEQFCLLHQDHSNSYCSLLTKKSFFTMDNYAFTLSRRDIWFILAYLEDCGRTSAAHPNKRKVRSPSCRKNVLKRPNIHLHRLRSREEKLFSLRLTTYLGQGFGLRMYSCKSLPIGERRKCC